jgi:hypothetical protein
MRHPRRTGVAGTLVVLAALAGLAGCSPADKPVAALRLVDGEPTLLIAECDDAEINTVSVYTSADGASVDEAWGARTDYLSPVEASEIRLLQTPPGWSLTDSTLTEFAPGSEYTVAAYGSSSDAFPIDFTMDQLAALGPDAVLVGESPSETKTRSEADFRDNAKDACDGGWPGLG